MGRRINGRQQALGRGGEWILKGQQVLGRGGNGYLRGSRFQAGEKKTYRRQSEIVREERLNGETVENKRKNRQMVGGLQPVKFQNSSISNNLVQGKYSFNFKNSSISNNLVQHKYIAQFYLTHRYDPFRCYCSRLEWSWERWQ